MTRILSGLGARQGIAFGLSLLCAASLCLVAAGPALALAPDAPTGVSASAGDASATVTWTAPLNDGGFAIDSYTVTAIPDGHTATTPDGVTLSATVEGLTNGTSYTFTVTAHNVDPDLPGDSAVSTPSNAVTPAAPATMPDAPTGVAATPLNGVAFLTWSAPTDNGSAITSYTITTHTTGSPPVTMATGTTGTTATVNDLTNGAAYTFTVAATNTVGTGPASPASNSVIPFTLPGTPPRPTATAGAGSATVDWAAPAENGSPITSYRITTTGPNAPTALDTGTAATSTTIGSLTNGAAYTFTVAATNTAGTGPDSLASIAVRPEAVPSAPSPPSATSSDRTAILTWSAPANNGSPITSYTVTATGTNAPAAFDTGTAATTATIGSLTNGAAYTFTVHATNGVGSGGESAPSNAVTPATVPGAPAGVAASPGNASATIEWFLPADNGGAAITSFTVSASSSTGALPAPVTVGSSATSQTFSGLTNGAAYTFTVVATNSAGTGAPSSSAVTPRTVPGSPTGVSASAGDGYVTVTWAAPANGSPVTSYTVATFGAGAPPPVTVDASTTSVIVSGLTNGVTYSFRVSATNAAGTVPARSILAIPAAPVVVTAASVRSGYWMVGADGKVYPFGDAKWLGDATLLPGVEAVDLEPTPAGTGYWIVDSAGHVFAIGAPWLGNAPASLEPGEKVTSLSSTRSGNGYWIFTTRGRVLTFGNAGFFGDMSAVALNGPVLDSIPSASGNGYYMVASDGGIFAFGDALFYGSMGGTELNAPVQSLVPDSDGVGYWLVAADGGIFSFEALFRGSMGGTPLNEPVTGMVRSGKGYLMVGEDGGIFDFSGTPDGFKGSLGADPPANPIVSVAVLEG